MSDKIHAADAIRASIRNTKALLDYADTLEKVGSIEQAEKEAIAATNKARQELAETAEQLSLMKELLMNAEASFKAKKAELEESEAQLIASAQSEAADIKAKAKAQSTKTINDAENQAKVITAQAYDYLHKLEENLATAKQEFKDLIQNKQRAEEDLAAINAKIEHAKLLVNNVFNG